MIVLSAHDQVVTVSETGGTVVRWQIQGIDILYPQQEVQRGTASKTRGGMHVCFPNFGPVDQSFGLPQHGPLRNRHADEIHSNGVSFRGTDLLGPSRALCEVRVVITLAADGFTYTLSARLNGGNQVIPVTAGFHPYFATPQGRACVEVHPTNICIIQGTDFGPATQRVRNSIGVFAPGVGTTQLTLTGAAWEAERAERHATLWRDSTDYVCVEPRLTGDGVYGTPACPNLSTEWLTLGCEFRFTPE